MTILNQILSGKRQELEKNKRFQPLAELKTLAQEQPPASDFAAALCGNGIRLIAEIKKASPSKGMIRDDFHPVQIAKIYATHGAAAISVVTEAHYFYGDLGYLQTIKKALGTNSPPLLRKDFIFDEYQVYETRACAADALLLIAAILTPHDLQELLNLSHNLGMSCLVEAHDEKEVQIAVESGARIIGINNRNLNTFEVDLTTTERLRRLIPPDRIVVSESGIKKHADIERLRMAGVQAVLVGEYFMSAPDIASSMRELL
jgi:indole-3-glycerol phosphate synthase